MNKRKISSAVAFAMASAAHTAKVEHLLERSVQKFVDDMAKRRPFDMTGLEANRLREHFNQIQGLAKISEQTITTDHALATGPTGEVLIRIVRPADSDKILPSILYLHGGGWVLGDRNTHDLIIRELAVRVGAAVVFIEYVRAPEMKYPTQIEQAYSATLYLSKHHDFFGLDPLRMAVAGDGAGGNLSAALTLLIKARGGPRLLHQVMFYPMMDSGFEQESYANFEDGPWITKSTLQWYWDCYVPKRQDRLKITASPLRATLSQLEGLPPATIITAEIDMTRDEGEEYARKLQAAGVAVNAIRYGRTIHDFVVLNALSGSRATQQALDFASSSLRDAFKT